MKNKNKNKSVKWSKRIIQQPNTLKSPNIIDIKSVTIEHPKTSHKLSKTIKQAKKCDQVGGSDNSSTSPFYSETKKKEKIFDEKHNTKNSKITKQSHAYKGYKSTCNIDLLNSFNPELQLKDSESAIKKIRKYLLTEMKGFKFLTTLAFESNKYKVMMKHNIAPFIRP